MATRFDVFNVTSPKKDANGFLVVDSTPTRAGVFIYKDSLGNSWGELRHPDDVFSKETLDSLNGIPYTIQENHVALFTPKDSRNKTYGFTLNDAKRVEDHAQVPIKIIDQQEIDAVENKSNLELSAGYRCDVINESGRFKGVEYNKRQKNIRYNHVARVKNARGGETCRIRLDSGDAICGVEAERIDSDNLSKQNNGESIMTLVKRKIPEVVIGDFRLDADPVEIPADYEGVVDRLEKRQDSMVSAIKERDTRIDSLTEDVKKAEARAVVLEKENKELQELNAKSIPAEKLDSAVEERARHIQFAKEYGVDQKLSNEQIRKEVVKKADKLPAEKLDDQTFVDVAFSMIDHDYEKKKSDSRNNLEKYRIDGGEKKVHVFDEAKKRRA